MSLRLTAKAKNRDEAEELMKPVLEKVKDILGDYIRCGLCGAGKYGTQAYAERNLTLSAADPAPAVCSQNALPIYPEPQMYFWAA